MCVNYDVRKPLQLPHMCVNYDVWEQLFEPDPLSVSRVCYLSWVGTAY